MATLPMVVVEVAMEEKIDYLVGLAPVECPIALN